MTERLFTETLPAALGGASLTERLSREVILAELDADAVRPLLTFDDLDELLATRPLEPPRVRLHREGQPVPTSAYTEAGEVGRTARSLIRPEALYRELRNGASLVLDSVDRLHAPVRDAADDLMRLVRERAQANLYLIWGDSHGFDTHWDDHDTFVIQVAGTKSWQVHGEGSRRRPMKVDSDHRHTPPEGTVWEGILRPGHVLHVPRGWWHTVKGTGDASMHLTFGFTRATGVDWARSVLERLQDVELFRADLPRFAPEEERRKHHDALVRRLVEAAEDHDVDTVLRERDARFPRRQSFALPWAVGDAEPTADTVVEFVPILTPPMERGGSAESGTVTLTVSGRRYRLPDAAEPILTELARERSLTAGALAERSGAPWETTVAVLRALVRNHLVLLRSPTR